MTTIRVTEFERLATAREAARHLRLALSLLDRAELSREAVHVCYALDLIEDTVRK